MANGFNTEFQSLGQLLTGLGYEMSSLTSPGTLFGFGQGQRFEGYDEFFSPFDVQGFEPAQASLRELESNLLANVNQQFSQQAQGLRQRYSVTMQDIRNQAGQTGLVSGAAGRQRRMASNVGMQEQQSLISGREQGLRGVQENIGRQLGQLEGTLLDFLGSQAQTALQIRSLDPTENMNPTTTYSNTMNPAITGFDYDAFLRALQGNINIPGGTP